jgi:transcriptional regulator with XRE-family HTH domain
MKTDNWLTNEIQKRKHTPEFRFEKLLIRLTEKICEKMASRRINRSQLADRLKVSPAAVTKILNGNPNFTLKTMMALADALDCDLNVDFRDKVIVKSRVVKLEEHRKSRTLNATAEYEGRESELTIGTAFGDYNYGASDQGSSEACGG